MMPNCFSFEQIGGALRQAERAEAAAPANQQGAPLSAFQRWRRRYVAAPVGPAKTVKQLQDENLRLNNLVNQLRLDKAILQDVARLCSGHKAETS